MHFLLLHTKNKIKQAGFAEPHSILTICWVRVGLWLCLGCVGIVLEFGLGLVKHLGPDKKLKSS